MKLILHIGTEKTGTTSLQRWLDLNSDSLQHYGVWYSASLGRPSNRKIALYARDSFNPDQGFLLHSVPSGEEHGAWKSQLEERLKSEIYEARKNKIRTFIISSEHCHSRLTSVEMIKNLLNLFSDFFEEIQVLCFVRPQVDLYVSLISNGFKNGIFEKRNHDLTVSDYFNYLTLYRKWSAVFGSSVHFIPHKRNTDTIDYFGNLLKLPAKALSSIDRQNPKLDYRVAGLIFNVGPQRIEAGKLNANHNVFAGSYDVEYPITISRSVAKKIQQKYSSINRELCEVCPGLEWDDLTPDYHNYPEKGNYDQIFQTVFFQPILQQMVVRFNAQSWLQNAQISLLQSRLALNQGQLRRAIDFAGIGMEHLLIAEQAKLEDLSEKIESVRSDLKRITDSTSVRLEHDNHYGE